MRDAHATDRPAALAPTDDVGFAHVLFAVTPLLLALTGCSTAGGQSAPPSDNASLIADNALSALDGFATDIEADWTAVFADRVFDPHSAARDLPHPPALAKATFGYFEDAVMTRQYSPAQLTQMAADHAGFVMRRDLDGDGVAETYRTGFWRIGDPRTGDAREGSFLAVFDPGRAPQVVDSSSPDGDGVFMSRQTDGIMVADCNCPRAGKIAYRDKRLTVTWSD